MSGVLPLGPGLQILDFESVDPTTLSVAQSGKVQGRKMQGQRWAMTVRWPRLKRTEFRAIYAFLVAQRGQFETFTLVPPVISVPQGVATGTPLVRYKNNLWNYSEQLSGGWGGAGISIASDVIAAPDGSGVTADKIVESSVSELHRLIRTQTFNAETNCVHSIFAKAGERSECAIFVFDGALSSYGYAVYNLNTGAITSSGIVGSAANLTTSIVPVAAFPGWYRLALGIKPGTGSTIQSQIRMHLAGNQVYLGDGASGMYFWGSQLESGLYPGPYTKTEASAITAEAPSGLALHTDGWTPSVNGILKAGDLFKPAGNNKIYMVSSDVNSDAGSMATLLLTSPLVATPADNEAITKTAVPFTVRMLKDSIRYRYTGALVDLEADFIEDLA